MILISPSSKKPPMQEKTSMVERFANLIIQSETPKLLFEVATDGHKGCVTVTDVILKRSIGSSNTIVSIEEVKLSVEDYVSTSEACKLYNVHPETIRLLCRDGLLKAEKVGGRWKILRKFLDEHFTKIYS